MLEVMALDLLLAPNDLAGELWALRLEDPWPLRCAWLTMSFSTSPPPRQKSSVRSKAGNGGMSTTVPEGGGTTSGENCCGASVNSFTHRRRSVLNVDHHTPSPVIRQHPVVA